MNVLLWLLSGLVTGWLARRLRPAPHWGLPGDLALGALGGLLGGGLLGALRATTALPLPGAAHVALAVAGAGVTLAAMRALDRAMTRAVHGLGAGAGGPTPGASLEAQIARLGAFERRVLSRVLRRERVARDPNLAFEEQLTFGQRVADRVASFGGSWPFIGLFMAVLLAWLLYNGEVLRPFDPYPFILLNLVLSCLAALQAPVIMMSQNRMSAKDRLDARHDYEVNLKAEMEITELHAKLDELVASRWQELLAIQARQVEALERIERRVLEGGGG